MLKIFGGFSISSQPIILTLKPKQPIKNWLWIILKPVQENEENEFWTENEIARYMNCTILTLLWKLTLIFEIASKIKSPNSKSLTFTKMNFTARISGPENLWLCESLYSDFNPKNNSSVKAEYSSFGDFTDFTVHLMQENSCDTAVDQGGARISAQVFKA